MLGNGINDISDALAVISPTTNGSLCNAFMAIGVPIATAAPPNSPWIMSSLSQRVDLIPETTSFPHASRVIAGKENTRLPYTRWH